MIKYKKWFWLVPAKCTSCGGVLSIEQDKDAAICPYCGNAFIVEKAIQSFSATYVINNIQANTVIMNGGQKDFEISAGTLIKYVGEGIDVIIPENVNRIGEEAFAKQMITSVDIPPSVKEIKKGAFYGCEKLKTVIFHNGLESIEKNAFAYCFELDELVLPDGVRLETDSFRHDKGLKKICISSNTININKDKNIFASDGSDYDYLIHGAIYVDGVRLYEETLQKMSRLKILDYYFFQGCILPNKTKTFSGITVEDAIHSACDYWNCATSDIQYNVIKEPKTTGLIKQNAKISATCLQ